MITLICIAVIIYSIVILVKFIRNMFAGKGCGDCTGCNNKACSSKKGGSQNCD